MQPGNLLNIESLSRDWHDKDLVMLHACFQLLKDFMEKEDCGACEIDWSINEHSRSAKKELDELYEWWLAHSASSLGYEETRDEENDMLIRLIRVRWALWT